MAANTVTQKGTAYTGNFIMQINRPLDDRGQVETKSKLLEFDNYVYPGMLVLVLDTGELYALVDVNKKSASDYSGWKNLTEVSGGIIDELITMIGNLNQKINTLTENQLHQYEVKITENVNTILIEKSVHKCGDHPCVTIYYKDQIVQTSISVDNGNLTIEWEEVVPSVQNPILVKIMGK